MGNDGTVNVRSIADLSPAWCDMAKKKVGLLSVPRYVNYGSQLQLFALQATIMRCGYECEVIDYDPPSHIPLSLPQRIRRVMSKPTVLITGMAERKRMRRYAELTAARQRLFREFLHQKINLGPKQYASMEALEWDPPQYDACVVGSDQVWSPTGHFGDRAYYLSFAAESKRIAYAPSIGVSELPPHTHEWMRIWINRVPHLSVREKTGAALIRQLTGREAQVVVDPTLLLTADEWSEYAADPVRPAPYVLCYALQGDQYIRDYATMIAREAGYSLVVLPMHAYDIEELDGHVEKRYDVGPSEFLTLIQNAACVCTDSFHGTIFSIIFRRPFFSFQRYDDKAEAAKFSRVSDMLDRLGLTHRIVSRETAYRDCWDHVDYASVEDALDAWKAASLEYLETALRKVTGGNDSPIASELQTGRMADV
jgi:hypothetical protein